MTKRPDQYRIAPGEAGATDYKTYPEQPDDLAAHPRPEAPATPWPEERGAPAGRRARARRGKERGAEAARRARKDRKRRDRED